MQHIIWQQKILLLFLFILIACIILSPLASNTSIPLLSDYINHLAGIAQAKMALTEGQFPLRVAPFEWSQARYPFFQFYSPTTYTIAGLLYKWLPVSNPFIIYKLTIGLGLLLGQIYMYRLSFLLTYSRSISLLTSLVYICAPYNIFVINFFGAFNEALALGVLPAVIYYSAQRYYTPNDKNLLQTSFFWYLLITIHLITFIISSCSIGILFLLLTLQNKSWKRLIGLIMAYFFGLLLAMWHIGPMILFAEHYFNISPNYEFTYKLSPSLLQLLSPIAIKNFTVVSQTQKFFTFAAPGLGLVTLLASSFCLYAYYKKIYFVKKILDQWLAPLILLFFIIFIFIWSPINIWKSLPPSLLFFQFTWRALSQSMWISALLFAVMMSWLYKNKLSIYSAFFIILLVILSSSSWLFAHQPKILFKPYPLAKKPTLMTNTGTYLMDIKKYQPYLNNLDSIDITENLAPNNILMFNKTYIIPYKFYKLTYSPIIIIKGEFPIKKSLPIQILINKKVIATLHTAQGKFLWVIPLASLTPSKSKEALQLTFISKEKNLFIPIHSIVLDGILNPKDILSLNQVKPYCHQEGFTTVCDVNPTNTTKLILLPILYYPDLLNVMLNEKPIPYQSVFHEDRIILGVKPSLNTLNHITVQFEGLKSANFISQVFWGLWVLFFFYTKIKMRTSKLHHTKVASCVATNSHLSD